MFEVSDDSGFLALVVPAAYETFVSSTWTFNQIMDHFQTQMARRSLLMWGTGLEGLWRVRLNRKKGKKNGFREVTGPLQVVGGLILLTNYESLTMAAQFEDVKLPQKHEEDLLIPLADGGYSCRILQMFDPENQECADDDQPDFLIEVSQTESQVAPWNTIPWFSKDH
jgi:hypothetical protein